ncbi:DUF222 domain-containing protein [Mycobacterium basiliense]
MSSSSREEIAEAFAELDVVVSRVLGLSFEVLTTPERLVYLERLEREARRLPVVGHSLINQASQQAGEEELGGTLPAVLARRLRITRAQAARRIAEAADLGPRRALSGEALAPRLTATAAAQRDGRLGEGQVRVIRDFFGICPPRWTSKPRRRPKPIWRGWRAGSVPINWPSWRVG